MAANEKKPRARAAAKPKAEAAPKKPVTRARKRAAAPVAATEVRPEHIAEYAYFLWQNGAGGDSTAHWLRAERELAAA